MKEKYKIELTKDEIQNLLYLCDFSFGNLRPFIPIELIRVEDKLRTIILSGCFKHNRICVKFKTAYNEWTTLCPLCNPEKYKELKLNYTEEKI